jgi:hypothetical protein
MARRSGAAEISAMFPGVSKNATARPQPSVKALIFVAGPPRENPIPCACAPFSAMGGAMGGAMGANRRGTDTQVTGTLGPCDKFFKYPPSQLPPAPAVETVIDGCRRP